MAPIGDFLRAEPTLPHLLLALLLGALIGLERQIRQRTAGLRTNALVCLGAAAFVDLAGTIGRRVLASPMPARRLRVSPRVVKRAISKYNARGNIERTTRKATITIAILDAPLTPDDEP